MAGSQLKRLKASLREQGITGPQQSKKQKRKAAQDSQIRGEKKLKKGHFLEGVRQQFNPFDLKHAARGPKFAVTTNCPVSGDVANGILGRPGQAKAAGEERRRETLLVDMQNRNKVGGINDCRFGENDPTMALEEKMLERFAREKQRNYQRSSMFDLEDDEPLAGGLTHMGQALAFDDDEPIDDFQEESDVDEDSDGSVRKQQRLKRVRAIAVGANHMEEEGQPERKKTKKEVMEEIIAKSKMHKHERQTAKEDDEILRAELDSELPAIQLLLNSGSKYTKKPTGEGTLASTIAGVERDSFEKNYDTQVKRLAQDRRAQPSERTKTEEERAMAESERLKDLEAKRQKRMTGEKVSDSDEDQSDIDDGEKKHQDTCLIVPEDDDDDFGLGSGLKIRPTARALGFDDEDDFIIDDNLVASGSDLELMDSNEESDNEDSAQGDEAEDEFTRGLLNDEEVRNPVFSQTPCQGASLKRSEGNGLPYTFPCPQSCGEFMSIAEAYPNYTLPTIVQRIRALYHPKLDSKNKERMSDFAVALVDFVATPSKNGRMPPPSALEGIVRHIHSLAKTFPAEIAQRFRFHIHEMGQTRPLALQLSDLILLTAAGTIFPASDHFHQVVTPAMLTIGRYLGQNTPQKPSDFATGTCLSVLSLQYQQLSKRFVPEVMNFCLNTLCGLAPVAPKRLLGTFPRHEPPAGTRLEHARDVQLRRLRFTDGASVDLKRKEASVVKVAALDTCIQVLEAAADLWTGKTAFLETFGQAAGAVKHLRGEACRKHLPAQLCKRAEKTEAKLERMLRLAQLSRRSLELHHHRPLAIKMSMPKFEETFDPDKHYDPDRERAELAKLRAEHKKERKGAIRELRKDARFMAREKLRIKKAKDEAYEKKYKRLVAEIQGEEGREANAYDREKQARKRARNR